MNKQELNNIVTEVFWEMKKGDIESVVISLDLDDELVTSEYHFDDGTYSFEYNSDYIKKDIGVVRYCLFEKMLEVLGVSRSRITKKQIKNYIDTNKKYAVIINFD